MTHKRLKREGDGASKLVQLIRDVGSNDSSTLTLGTVLSAPPEITVQLDNDPIVLDRGDLIIAQRLTAHDRIANVFSANVLLPMSAEGYTTHTHAITSITLNDAVISYTDELAPGDRVLVECDDERMKYTIIDRAVTY